MNQATSDHPRMPKSAFGRVDLLCVWASLGEQGLTQIAALLDFEPELEKPDQKPKKDLPELPPSNETASALSESEQVVDRDFHFEPIRLVTFEESKQEYLGEPEWYRDLAQLEDEEMAADYEQPIPVQTPLLPWAKLWPFLHGALGAWHETGPLRVSAVIDAMISGRWPSRVPRRRRLTWAGQCHLILDSSPRLTPYWHDHLQTIEKLKKVRGKTGLQIWIAEHGARQPWHKFGEDRMQFFPALSPGTPVMVLGDLGQYMLASEEVRQWHLFGQKLGSNGCPALALVPCPRYLWDKGLAQVWRMAVWDDSECLPPVTVRGVCRQSPQTELADEVAQKRDCLAQLLAPAVRVEPGLLRAARRCLPKRRADVGSEYHFWNHEHVQASALMAAMQPGQRKHYQEAFAWFGRAVCLAVLETMEKHHAWLSPALSLEEQSIGHRLLGLPFQAADDYFKRLSKRVTQARDCLGAYVDQWVERQDERAWQEGEGFVITYMKRHETALLEGRAVIPNGLDVYQHRWALGLATGIETWRLTWRGARMRFTRTLSPALKPGMQTDVTLGRIAFQGDFLAYWSGDLGQGQALRLREGASLTWPASGGLTIQSHAGRWRFEAFAHQQQPAWAKALGCDARGIFAELKDSHAGGKLRWLPPGPYAVVQRDGQRVGNWSLESGCWMAEDQFALFETGTFTQPAWTDSGGVDDDGIYADWGYQGVVQRFRWIFPGAFLMGSPADEPGRYENETQHHVTLTRGFWLADTACTQALWQAVTGGNPSAFKGQDRPVETVSWEDCVTFFEKLEVERPGLNLGLAGEAQWEYACRAGTATAFHFGTGITTDQVNYGGGFSRGKSRAGAYRECTVAVKALPANPWGLYQMHGNVWEWCADRWGGLPAEAQVDSSGPDSGQRRVLRGGSWYDFGRLCRSAFRLGNTPDYRNDDAGFRLARGQKGKEQVAQGRTEDGDRPRSGHGAGSSL